MIKLSLTVADIDAIMAAGYTHIKVYTDTSSTGDFTTNDGSQALTAEQTGYTYVDTDGTTSTWYKVTYWSDSLESSKSSAFQGGTVTPYCTPLDVRKELATATASAAIGEEYDSVLWEMCLAASRLIDKEKRVEEGAYRSSTSEDRYFDGTGDAWQEIDPAVSVSGVAVEESDGTYTSWVSTDYFTWPYATTAFGEPIIELRVNEKSDGSKSTFTRGSKRVKITGVFGVSTTPPAAVKRACIIQVSRWYKRAQQAWQDASANIEVGELTYVQKIDPDVARLLQSVYPTLGGGL